MDANDCYLSQFTQDTDYQLPPLDDWSDKYNETVSLVGSFNEDVFLHFEPPSSPQSATPSDGSQPATPSYSSQPATPSNNSQPATPSYSSQPATPSNNSQPPTPSAMVLPILAPETKGHQRSGSVISLASIQSRESIADLKIEETKCDTGVEWAEIEQYMLGPATDDGRWTCNFENCNKVFGRKENIKSHVQTHLNDRQYQCPTCTKRFVRQHDLKRHAKIHTGVKPYACDCGNRFARHDALTRHKQRGMCIGAFDGIIRKVGKRGRPRKNQLDKEPRPKKSPRHPAMSPQQSSSQQMSPQPISPRDQFPITSSAPMPYATEASFYLPPQQQPLVSPTSSLFQISETHTPPATYQLADPQTCAASIFPLEESIDMLHSDFSMLSEPFGDLDRDWMGLRRP